MHVKSASFSTDNGQTSRFSFFYRISNDKNFIPKYLDNALTDSVLTSRTSRRLLEEKAPVIDFRRTVPREKSQHENGDLRRIKVCVNRRKVGHPTLRKLSTARKGL